MIRRAVFLFLVVMACVATGARASWLIGADGGIAFPAGTFNKVWSSGFSASLSASYLLSPRFAVGLTGSRNGFGTASDYQAFLDFLDPGASETFTAWQFGAHGNWMIPVSDSSKFSPYVVLGVGLYNVKDKYESPTGTDELSQTAFGFRGGLGCDYWISPTFGLGLDTNYNDTFTNVEDIGYGNTPYFTVAAGVRWKPKSSK